MWYNNKNSNDGKGLFDMSLALEDFVGEYLYSGQLVEVSSVGPDMSEKDIVYEGPCDEIPENLRNLPVEYVAMSGRPDDPYTIRIECELDSVSHDVFERETLQGFVDYFLYEGQEIEIAGIGPDEADGNFVRYEGTCDEIPEELADQPVKFVAASGNPETPYRLRVECEF